MKEQKTDEEMTLAEHAEYWWRQEGKEVPPRGTDQWQAMYETWVNWAFSKSTANGENALGKAVVNVNPPRSPRRS